MKNGDKVQVQRFGEGYAHWLYAVVVDAAANRVEISHPGNKEDGKVLTAATSDVRTAADVQSLIDQAAPIVAKAGQRGLTPQLIRQLADLDGFWSSYLPPANGQLTADHSKSLVTMQETMHKQVVKHYQNILKALS